MRMKNKKLSRCGDMQTITLFVKLIHEEKQHTSVKQSYYATRIHKIEVQFSRKISFVTRLDIANILDATPRTCRKKVHFKNI